MPVALTKRQTSTAPGGTTRSMRPMSNRRPLMVNGLPIIPPSRLKVRTVAPVPTKTAGAVEVWRFVNATGMAHPMHVHGVRMSLLSRDGSTPAPQEQGLRDTFVVDAMQTISVALQTPLVASPVPLMFHCHILEHEDAGMMGQFITT
jgi:bilirubin oxidase